MGPEAAREVIVVDGSHGEGGGQILRTAVALAAITGKACRVERIRAGRPKPGLAASHLTALRAAAAVCGGQLRGAEIGSSAVEFEPGEIRGGRFEFDIGTAGAVTLVLQGLVPIALRADQASTFVLRGGTDVPWSPPIEYFEHIFCWWLQRMGAEVYILTRRHGFYPKGGGQVEVTVHPASSLRPVRVTQAADVSSLHVLSLASKDLSHARVAERQVEGFRRGYYGPFEHTAEYVPAFSPGSSLHAHAHIGEAKVGANALGRRGVKAEAVGAEAAKNLHEELEAGATLDRYMSDQILLYAALADGPSEFTAREVTGHAETTMWLLPQFLDCGFKTEPQGKRVRIAVTPR